MRNGCDDMSTRHRSAVGLRRVGAVSLHDADGDVAMALIASRSADALSAIDTEAQSAIMEMEERTRRAIKEIEDLNHPGPQQPSMMSFLLYWEQLIPFVVALFG
jgi:hypothetical protein